MNLALCRDTVMCRVQAKRNINTTAYKDIINNAVLVLCMNYSMCALACCMGVMLRCPHTLVQVYRNTRFSL